VQTYRGLADGRERRRKSTIFHFPLHLAAFLLVTLEWPLSNSAEVTVGVALYHREAKIRSVDSTWIGRLDST